jgi:hypothetical protein
MSQITDKSSESPSSDNAICSNQTEKITFDLNSGLKVYSQVSPSPVSLILWRTLGIVIFAVGIVITALTPGKTRELLELMGIVIPHPIDYYKVFHLPYVIFDFIKGALSGLIMFAGAFLFLRAKRLAAVRKASSIKALPESFVLYLRSFGVDDRMSTPVSSGKFIFPVTKEEQLAIAVKGIGPLLAVGLPGEKLPKVGALRIYVEEDNWQSTVRILMSRARLIIFLAGFSNGFWWELDHAIHNINPEKVIVLIPFNKKVYQTFRSEAAERLILDFPKTKRFPWWERSFRGVVYFDASAKPHLHSAINFDNRDFFRLGQFSITRGAASYLRILLRPVYKNLCIDWHPLRAPLGSLVIIIFGFAFLTLAIVTSMQKRAPELTIDAMARNKIHNILTTNQTAEQKLKSMSKQERKVYIARLMRDGLWRLDTPILLQRAALFEKLLYAADTSVCARMTFGNANDEEIQNVLHKFADTEQTIYWDIIVAALKTGLSAESGPQLDEKSVDAAFDALFTELGPKDADRVWNVIVNRQDVNPNESCWAGRTLYRHVNKMSEPHKSTLARALIAP